ncbi:recombination protein [Pseudomonas phage BHU-1]|nr:recombination protein [Pseudomonas phage BHU-1]UGV19936.1 recombination protein [Pseudomonas phage Pa BHU-15]UIW13624.1 recombination protein [Pseudomonas phage Pa BHU-17]
MRIRRTKSDGQLFVLGVDPSLGSTGYCYEFDGRPVVGRLCTKFRGMQRLEHQLNQFRGLLDTVMEEATDYRIVCVYEGYAIGAKGVGRWESAELGGQFKLELYKRGIPVILVPPTTLKLVFTGKGNSKKPAMKAAAIEHFGVDSSLNNDEVDAYALYRLGHALLHGIGPAEFLQRALRAKSKVTLHPGKGAFEMQALAHLASVG